MASSNTRQTRQQLAQQRGGNAVEATPIAYEGEGGVPREVEGDAQGPHIKVPPFTEDPQLWQPDILLPTTPYLALPQVDTRQYRLLTAYITYSIPTGGEPPMPFGSGQLSLVPEKLAIDAQSELQWYTTSLVDVTLTARTLAAPWAALVTGFGSRDFFPAEFRWPSGGGMAGPAVLRTMLTFEVSDADAFRLNVADPIVGGARGNTFSALFARSQ